MEPVKKQVRGKVNQQRHSDKISQQVHPCGNHLLFMEEQATCPVDIRLRPPEKIHRDHHPCHQCLQLPSASVVTQPPDRPYKKRWRRDMKQAQQTNCKTEMRIEHVLRAA